MTDTVRMPTEMKGNPLIVAPLCLLLCWMQPGDSKKISSIFTPPKVNRDIRMDMVEEAVDDMYSGCGGTMTNMIKDGIFKNESTGTFAKAWKNAEKCANRRVKNQDEADKALTKDHKQAICVYTSEFKQFYVIFNTAVRTNRAIDSTSFPFHSLHFWLTSAVQILSNNKGCLTTYRRSKDVFTGKVNQIIRFGSFASSSKKTDLTRFGSKTCFKITTCEGAFLKEYHTSKNYEQEVLIPPYEKFRIVAKKLKHKAHVDNLTDCEVVYFLKSAGIQSNRNCGILNKK